ncbi:hypothetical protein [Candidatus Amarobacter glycogenicus]|uniref:hypothetical protein n=1 Tax=Candidatus Amarobacter glycogenicus TaxID=3140699 RepID=UPI002A1840D8|nr:hypothetical protein [Dehalococcoidia bacterium]
MADAPLITSEEFDTLEAEWAALWATVGDATPFQHPAWYRVWLRHFGSGTSPVFLSIRRGEHLVGVAALDMDREEARQLGDHNVQDYAGPLWLPGEEGSGGGRGAGMASGGPHAGSGVLGAGEGLADARRTGGGGRGGRLGIK